MSGALRVVRRLRPLGREMSDKNQRAALCEWLGDGDDSWWGSRVRDREETAAVGENAPGGGRLHELSLREPHAVGIQGKVVVGRRIPRRERVGLGPDLDADLVHARRDRL